MAARGACKVVSVNGALTVTFTTAAGGTPAVYSDEACTSAISLPATVADGANTTFYFASPGAYTLSVKTSSGTQIAGDLGSTRIVTVFTGETAVLTYDTRIVARDASGDSGRNAVNAALATTYRSLSTAVPARAQLPGAKGLTADMASPPTVTLGVANAASVITSSKTWQPDAPGLFFDSIRTAFGQNFPNTLGLMPMATAGTNNTDAAVATPTFWRRSFYTDAPQIEVYWKGTGTSARILADGAYVTAGGATTITHAADGSGYRDLIDFTAVGGRKIRRIDIDFDSNANVLYGIGTAITDTIFAAPSPGLTCVAVGDSFIDGTGATKGFNHWTQTFQQMTGWSMVSVGAGGTGYLQTNGARPKYRDRMANDVYPYAPDVVLVFGGINDYGSFTAAAIGTEAAALYADIKANLPNAKLIVVGPEWRNGVETFGVNLLATRDAIKTAALAAGAMWIDLLELPATRSFSYATTLAAGASGGATTLSVNAQPEAFSNKGQFFTIEVGNGTANRERRVVTAISGAGPYSLTVKALTNAHSSGETVTAVGPCFWTGTGKVGTTTGDGNSDFLVLADGTHPSQAGHDAMARAIFDQIAVQLVAA